MKHLKYLSLLLAAGVLAGCATGAPRQPAPVYDDNTVTNTPTYGTTTSTNRNPKRRISAAPIQDGNAVIVDDNQRQNAQGSGTITIERPQTYRVQRGDTLYSVSRKYNISPQDLADLNDMSPDGTLRTGQKLVLPVDDSVNNISTQPEVAITPSRASVPIKSKPSVRTTTDIAGSTPRHNTASVTSSCPNPADETLQFVSPAEGELIGGFSETGTQKGIEIASDFGAPVVASAAGEVVYSGTGLRGYGKLVLIKHNSSYITAYAHNSKLLVKQGQTVEQGEQIAEMGNTDTNRVELYFEVRRCGKAVDPSKYLPLN
jgi:lipoprotein NlpD